MLVTGRAVHAGVKVHSNALGAQASERWRVPDERARGVLDGGCDALCKAELQNLGAQPCDLVAFVNLDAFGRRHGDAAGRKALWELSIP